MKSRRVLELAERVEELHSHSYASYRAAFALIHAGRIEEANGQVQENLAAAERLRDRGLMADALYVKALLAQLRGQREEARAQSDRGWRWRPAIYRFSMRAPFSSTKRATMSPVASKCNA